MSMTSSTKASFCSPVSDIFPEFQRSAVNLGYAAAQR